MHYWYSDNLRRRAFNTTPSKNALIPSLKCESSENVRLSVFTSRRWVCAAPCFHCHLKKNEARAKKESGLTGKNENSEWMENKVFFFNGWVKVYQNKRRSEKESHTLQLKPLTFSWCSLICKGNMVLCRFTLNFRLSPSKENKRLRAQSQRD